SGRSERLFTRLRLRATNQLGLKALARLAVRRHAPAPLAELAQLQALGVVALALVCLVIAALAFLAREGGSDPNVSTGHDEIPLRDVNEGLGLPAEGALHPRSTGARAPSLATIDQCSA